MQTPRLLTLLAAALFCAASPQSSPAADVLVDISSFAPRDPNVVVRQIELNVAIRQYEKVRMDLYEASLQSAVGPTETGLTEELRKEWYYRAEKKLKYLKEIAAEARDQIDGYVAKANKDAELIEKAKTEKEAKQKAAPNQPTAEPRG